MNNKNAPPAKPYVYAFTSGRLVLLVCLVLGLMVLSLMLGIRIEGYQQTGGESLHEAARQLPEPRSLPAQPADLAETSAMVEQPQAAEPIAALEPGVEALTSPAQASAPSADPKTPQPAQTPKPEAEPVAASPRPEPVKPPPAAPKPATAPKEVSKVQFLVQVSSSQDKSMAVSQAELLTKKGFAASVETVDLDKGRFYRVMVGPFPTEAEAQRVRGQLIKDPMFADSYVRRLP